MKPQPLPALHHQVFTCVKCHALCLSEDLSKSGKCPACSGNKYNARKVKVGSITFDSQKEATRYQQLLWRQKTYEIGPIMLQPPYLITMNGVHICTYYADFCYTILATGEVVIEDCKGGEATKTPTYRLKKKLVEATYGIKITEV